MKRISLLLQCALLGSLLSLAGCQTAPPKPPLQPVASVDLPRYMGWGMPREQRDYVWIMARTPRISAAEYDALTDRVRAMGYDMSLLRRVPQTQP